MNVLPAAKLAEIRRMRALGHGVREIARALEINKDTVSHYVGKGDPSAGQARASQRRREGAKPAVSPVTPAMLSAPTAPPRPETARLQAALDDLARELEARAAIERVLAPFDPSTKLRILATVWIGIAPDPAREVPPLASVATVAQHVAAPVRAGRYEDEEEADEGDPPRPPSDAAICADVQRTLVASDRGLSVDEVLDRNGVTDPHDRTRWKNAIRFGYYSAKGGYEVHKDLDGNLHLDRHDPTNGDGYDPKPAVLAALADGPRPRWEIVLSNGRTHHARYVSEYALTSLIKQDRVRRVSYGVYGLTGAPRRRRVALAAPDPESDPEPDPQPAPTSPATPAPPDPELEPEREAAPEPQQVPDPPRAPPSAAPTPPARRVGRPAVRQEKLRALLAAGPLDSRTVYWTLGSNATERDSWRTTVRKLRQQGRLRQDAAGRLELVNEAWQEAGAPSMPSACTQRGRQHKVDDSRVADAFADASARCSAAEPPPEAEPELEPEVTPEPDPPTPAPSVAPPSAATAPSAAPPARRIGRPPVQQAKLRALLAAGPLDLRTICWTLGSNEKERSSVGTMVRKLRRQGRLLEHADGRLEFADSEPQHAGLPPSDTPAARASSVPSGLSAPLSPPAAPALPPRDRPPKVDDSRFEDAFADAASPRNTSRTVTAQRPAPVKAAQLSPAEQAALVERVRAGDHGAWRPLWESVVNFARAELGHRGVQPAERADAEQDVQISMLRAIHTFDLSRGGVLGWVRWQVIASTRHTYARRSPIRLTDGLREKLFSVSTGRKPASAFSAATQASIEAAKRVQRVVSADAPLGHDNERTLLDTLAASDGGEDAIVAALDGHRESSAIVKILDEWRAQLSERDRAIYDHRIATDEEDAPMLRVVGDRFGISRERVRQLETKLRARLRKWLVFHRARVPDGRVRMILE